MANCRSAKKTNGDVKVNLSSKEKSPVVSEDLTKEDGTIAEGRDDTQSPPAPPNMETDDRNKL